MIWIFWFYSFFFLSLKESLFLSGSFNFDSFSMFMMSISPLILYMILFFSFPYSGKLEMIFYFVYFFFIIMLTNFCFCVNNSFFFLLFLELSVYPMSFLILSFSKDKDKFSSVLFMVFMNIAGSIPFMIFSGMFIFNGSSFYCSTYFSNFIFFHDKMVFFCLLLILISKLPLFLFHFWLTKAHVSASGSCSMLLASLMLKLGSFGMVKFSFLFLPLTMIYISDFISLSLIGCFFFSLLMIRFFDMKNLIACSSVLHMSLIFPMTLFGSGSSLISSMFMMTSHGLVSYFLFLLISLIYECSLNRSFDFNKSTESFSKIFSMIMFLFIFLNLGVPPFLNFYGEMYFFVSLLNISLISTFLFSIVMVFSIIFTMYLGSKILFGKKIIMFSDDIGYINVQFSYIFVFFLFLLPFLS